MEKMINIAVDGPAGAGKSFLARQIAAKLGYIYVDTGALYRTIALNVFRKSVDASDKDAVIASLDGLKVKLEYTENGEQHVFLNGEDVNGLIRQPEISMLASKVSAIPEVRAYLLGIQRDMAKTNNVVMDGRDIGTVILPDAQVKIFLCANEKARAKRRYMELIEKGVQTTLEEVESEMTKRDKNDSTREVAPAVPASDAVILDNSELDRDGTIEAALKIIADKIG